ncbi:hypothetical protein FRB95_014346 [Tulasnella sp. JGI-2019a]|nr:hypothetical protein FRB93_002696 [Tulasnella sp. JGI-2019a]KAG9038797.1 hypothetical protein FRB95_014346 [Tulasnella sp. JGI-2019a]
MIMPGDLSMTTGHLLGFGFGMLMYGWYLGLFFRLLDGLWARRWRSKVVVGLVFLLFILTTLNIVLCIVNEYDAWVKHSNNGALNWFLTEPWKIKDEVDYFFLGSSATTFDILLLWRLYLIWDKNILIVAAPVILLIVDIIIQFVIIFTTFAIQDPTGGHRYGKLFLNGTYFTTGGALVIHTYYTSMIIARLWSTTRTQGRCLFDRLSYVAVQSGLIWTIIYIFFASFSLAGYVGGVVFLKYIVIMVIGIVPLLIVKQLHANPCNADAAGSLVEGSASVRPRSDEGGDMEKAEYGHDEKDKTSTSKCATDLEYLPADAKSAAKE